MEWTENGNCMFDKQKKYYCKNKSRYWIMEGSKISTNILDRIRWAWNVG